MTTNKLLLLFALLLTGLSGCRINSDDDQPVIPTVVVPATYDFLRGTTSSVSFEGQRTRIAMAQDILDALADPNTTEEDLNNMFRNTAGTDPFPSAELNASTKSVRSKVAASNDLFATNATDAAAFKADFDSLLAGQAREVFPNWNELAAPGQAGQIADGSSTRYVNALGLEYNQAFAKGLIGALMYDQAVNNYLSPAVLDAGTNRADNDAAVLVEGENYTNMEHKWDEAYGYVFGAAADPRNGLADLGEADDFLNKYLGRVEDDPDYAGIAAEIEQSFRIGRAALSQGDYLRRDQEGARIRARLSAVLVIRAVYYLAQAQIDLEATPAATGSAFHALSEAYGFIYSLRFIARNETQLATATEISDRYLATMLNADDGGFWTVDPAELGRMAREIAARYEIVYAQAAN